ncbi:MULTISPECIES: hypothetical protein [Streptomyces]|uniref:hypothetical protein n=1 Tax=Streptomyces TaxID=1883 RepID=UPI00068FE73A|nr:MULTISPECIES: hypothetical protein [Streptomyces]
MDSTRTRTRPAVVRALAPARCAAGAGTDTPCEGGRAVVRVVAREGTEVSGCIPHAALLYATSVGARLYASPGHAHTLSEVYARAQMHDRPTSRLLDEAA